MVTTADFICAYTTVNNSGLLLSFISFFSLFCPEFPVIYILASMLPSLIG